MARVQEHPCIHGATSGEHHESGIRVRYGRHGGGRLSHPLALVLESAATEQQPSAARWSNVSWVDPGPVHGPRQEPVALSALASDIGSVMLDAQFCSRV